MRRSRFIVLVETLDRLFKFEVMEKSRPFLALLVNNKIHFAQHADRSIRHVLEVSDRRSDEVQDPGHLRYWVGQWTMHSATATLLPISDEEQDKCRCRNGDDQSHETKEIGEHQQ